MTDAHSWAAEQRAADADWYQRKADKLKSEVLIEKAKPATPTSKMTLADGTELFADWVRNESTFDGLMRFYFKNTTLPTRPSRYICLRIPSPLTDLIATSPRVGQTHMNDLALVVGELLWDAVSVERDNNLVHLHNEIHDHGSLAQFSDTQLLEEVLRRRKVREATV